MGTTRITTSPAAAPVKGKRAHLPGDNDQPLCDRTSYEGSRWIQAMDFESTTCKHCRNKVERESGRG
jgi:hypothetical protein